MKIIRLDSPFVRAVYTSSNKIFWQIIWRKTIKMLIAYSIISVFLITLGLLLIEISSIGELFFFIGIGFSILSLLMALFIVNSWTAHNKKIKSAADRYEQVNTDYVFELSDDAVKHWDFEKSFVFKWSAFSHYTVYKGYIVLFANNSMTGAFIFCKNEQQGDEYENIFKLVNTKLAFKKII